MPEGGRGLRKKDVPQTELGGLPPRVWEELVARGETTYTEGKNGALGRRDDHIPSRGKESWIRTRSGQGRAGEGHSFRVGTWHGEEGRDHIPGWAGLVHEGQERTIILIISLCSSPLLPMRRVLGTLDIVACWR